MWRSSWGKILNFKHYNLRSGNQSESEYEDDENNEVVLPQTLNSRGNLENNKSAIRLHEIGPRLTIELIKIQNDLFTGEVLYHNAIVKTEEEIAELKKLREEKKRQKELRKKIQSENVAKKEHHKDEHKKRSMAGKVKPEQYNPNEVEHTDNDAEYYKEEVGESDEGMGKNKFLATHVKWATFLCTILYSLLIYSFVTELFQTETVAGGRKRAFVPKHMKHGKDKDAKRRKIDKSDGSHHGAKKFNKSDDKDHKQFNKQKGEKKFSGNTNVDKSSSSSATSKKLKKTKPKKGKGKKKTNRNKNK